LVRHSSRRCTNAASLQLPLDASAFPAPSSEAEPHSCPQTPQRRYQCDNPHPKTSCSATASRAHPSNPRVAPASYNLPICADATKQHLRFPKRPHPKADGSSAMSSNPHLPNCLPQSDFFPQNTLERKPKDTGSHDNSPAPAHCAGNTCPSPAKSKPHRLPRPPNRDTDPPHKDAPEPEHACQTRRSWLTSRCSVSLQLFTATPLALV
jgi:hypothetical protein